MDSTTLDRIRELDPSIKVSNIHDEYFIELPEHLIDKVKDILSSPPSLHYN